MKQKQRKPKPNSRPPQKKVPVRKKRRRRGRNLLYYIMFTMIAVAVGLILSLTVFFKIETIEAEGLTHYTPEEVTDFCMRHFRGIVIDWILHDYSYPLQQQFRKDYTLIRQLFQRAK